MSLRVIVCLCVSLCVTYVTVYHCKSMRGTVTYSDSDLLYVQCHICHYMPCTSLRVNVRHSALLYVTVRHCMSLHGTVRHCMPLCVTVCHRNSLYATVRHCPSLYITICHCVSLYVTVRHCASPYVTVRHYMSLYATVRHCTSTVRHCMPLYVTVHHCTLLCVTVRHCTSLYITVCHCTSLYVTVRHCKSLHGTLINGRSADAPNNVSPVNGMGLSPYVAERGRKTENISRRLYGLLLSSLVAIAVAGAWIRWLIRGQPKDLRIATTNSDEAMRRGYCNKC